MTLKKKIEIEICAGSELQSETFDEFIVGALEVREKRHKKNTVEIVYDTSWRKKLNRHKRTSN